MSTAPRNLSLSLNPWPAWNDRGAWYGYGPEGDDTENGWGATFVLDGIKIDTTEPVLVTWQWNPEDGFRAKIRWYGERYESYKGNGCTDLGAPRTLAGLTLKIRQHMGQWRSLGRVTVKAPKLDSITWPNEF